MGGQKFNIVTLLLVVCLVSSSAFVYWKHEEINLLLTYGFIDLPTHEAEENCTWVKRTFSRKGISFFEQNCPTPPNFPYWIFYEDSEGRVISEMPDENRRLKTIELLTKDKGAKPYDVIKNVWYDSLTPDQRKTCVIESADQSSSVSEVPHKTSHKLRYRITPKSEVIEAILNMNSGVTSGPGYDFLCGNIVGSIFNSSSPYFEFDDRSPDKYLFIRSFGNDGGPPIDLNSIRF